MRARSRRRPRSSLLTLVFATGAALSLSVATASSAAERTQRQAQKPRFTTAAASLTSAPLSGIYDACSYAEPKSIRLPDCTDRLIALKEGGFELVVNYSTDVMSVSDNLRYANTAASLGLQVIWNLSNYTGAALDSKLGLVRATAAHPATWGYYVGDEVLPAERWRVAEVSGAVRSLTHKPLLFVSRPSPSLMRAFKDLADYIGPDDYPYGRLDPPVCGTSRWATKMVRDPVMVLQAYSWSVDYPHLNPVWPNAAQMRQMRRQATRCGDPALILWFCFHCITDFHPDPDAYWRELAWAANGVDLGPSYRMSSLSSVP